MSESTLTSQIREAVKNLKKIAFENRVIILCAKDEIKHAGISIKSILERIKDLESKALQLQETVQNLDEAMSNFQTEPDKMLS